MAISGLHGEIVLVDFVSGHVVASRSSSGTPVFAVSWSPSGDILAAARYNGTAQCLRGNDLSLIQEFQTGTLSLSAIAFDPMQPTILAGGRNKSACLVAIPFPLLNSIRDEMRAYVENCKTNAAAAAQHP